MSARLLSAIVGSLVVSLVVVGVVEGQEIDPRTGLVRAPGFDKVATTCTECHSPSLIVQTRARREDWLGLLRWMEATQEMPRLDPESERIVVDYLTTNYGPSEARFRRAPLAPELMPPPATAEGAAD